MDLETFTANFPLLADTPNGIPKLREMTLQLAVRGKLVSQDPEEEPASVLFQKIVAEKERLTADGIIKKPKPLPPIELHEVPYQLPRTWAWTRLGDLILSITGGGTPSKSNSDYWDGEIPWASVKDLGSGKYLDSTQDTITQMGLNNSSTNLIPSGRVIVCTRMGLGKIVINSIATAINQDLKALQLSSQLNIDFFYILYSTLNIAGSGMTVKGVRQDKLLTYLTPLPPLAEQKRIVQKGDELMALCDKLEERQKRRDSVRVSMNGACLHELTSPEPDKSQKGWTRTCDHFDLLYDTPDNVAALRKSILQLAVMGKLVPQDPNDEHAAVLFEKIAAEKKRLIAEGKVKKSKPLPPIAPHEVPYELPEGWVWVRLGSLQEFINGYTFPSKDYVDEGIGVVRIGDLQNGQITTADMKRVSSLYLDELEERLQVKPGNLLIAMSGATTGKLAFNRTSQTFLLNQRVGKLKLLLVDYMYGYFFLSTKIQENLSVSAGSAIPNLSTKQINEMLFPLPPLAEQKFIVAKVDELMTLLDDLESKLQKSRSIGEKLMAAVVNQVTML